MNICKERFDRGAAAAVCRQLGYVDADIAEPRHGGTPPSTSPTSSHWGMHEKKFHLMMFAHITRPSVVTVRVHKSDVVYLL